MEVEMERASRTRPATISEEEWRLRLQLAACYRLVDWFGWSDAIANHISLRLPGAEKAFLINPFGLHYCEVTASNLLKINTAGDKLDESIHPVNKAGFVIHSAIHEARDDAHCVLHTHTTAGMAVACKVGGLRNDNVYSFKLHGKVAYHDFEGVTTDREEQPRLVANLGDKKLLILRNHGLLAMGRTVSQAFYAYWTLQRACEVQVLADSMAGPTLAIPEAAFKAAPTRRTGGANYHAKNADLVFAALLRKARISFEEVV